MRGTTIDLVLFGLAIVLFVRYLYDFFTAKPRTRRHVFLLLLLIAMVVLQIDAVLPLDSTWRNVKDIASLAILISAMWYGSDQKPTSDPRHES